MIQIIAAFSAGTFFGAAIYINLAQHPATISTGADFAGKFFPPMYAKASILQIALALIGTILGIVAWLTSSNPIWLIGSIFLISVVPITIIFIKPINDQLLDDSKKMPHSEIEMLLDKWNPRHWVRTIVSGVAFLLFLFGISQ